MQCDLVNIQTHDKSSCSLSAYSNTEGRELQLKDGDDPQVAIN
ncbi:hypothetical protein HMPREF0758_2858 [Serratia odorifera DSM 4582]|uniref:Uncharacterized protein n=1 Tax=Serratia odorifera DSM 4582 TaxID=667129 RepID=D4E3V8_SEROD|nr:hypothetical protein HMPREF0758_2858 [Serratia odorifera DSM 4582]